VATLGRLAKTHDEVTASVDAVRTSLPHDDAAVQHDTVEAVATLVRERPAAVASTAGDLRRRLDRDDVAVQHNAVGALAHLADTRPAVEDLRALADHGEPAIQRVGVAALRRLASEHAENTEE
jgi:hypothetical protein